MTTHNDIANRKWQNYLYLIHRGRTGEARQAFDAWWNYCEQFLSAAPSTAPNWNALSPETVAYRRKWRERGEA